MCEFTGDLFKTNAKCCLLKNCKETTIGLHFTKVTANTSIPLKALTTCTNYLKQLQQNFICLNYSFAEDVLFKSTIQI
jgi:uncharacterized cysteine cluster protein YcgN (CxxCxxCC family)